MSGNGDAYYEELAEQARKVKDLLEEHCNHEWQPVTRNARGVTTLVMCENCGMRADLVIKPRR